MTMSDTKFPDYRVYRHREEFSGTDVFELFPGDFSGEVHWWNPGSVYVREEALCANVLATL